MFNFASRNKHPTNNLHHAHRQSEFYSSRDYFDEDTSYGGAAACSVDLQTPSPVAGVNRGSQLPRPGLHKRSLTAASSPLSPPSTAPVITNFSKPSVYPQESSLRATSIFDPITDITLELSPPSSPATSPGKDRWSFLSNLKPDSASGSPTKSSFESGRASPTKSESSRKSENSPARIADWFQGESAPLAIGVTSLPSPIKDVPNPMDSIPNLVPGMLTRRPTLNSKPSSATMTTPSSPFSIFNKLTRSPTTPSHPTLPTDEFLSLDPKSALAPEPNQYFTPAAYKTLQAKSEALLTRMQAAYRTRTETAIAAETETSALRDELDESSTRATHLKIQLDDLSLRCKEQNDIIAELVEQLAREKAARREDAARRSVRVVSSASGEEAEQEHEHGQELEGQKRGGRSSNASTYSSLLSDSGFESNDDDDASLAPSSATSPSLHSHEHEGKEMDVTLTPMNFFARQEKSYACAKSSPLAMREGVETGVKTGVAELRQESGSVEDEIDRALELVREAIAGLKG